MFGDLKFTCAVQVSLLEHCFSPALASGRGKVPPLSSLCSIGEIGGPGLSLGGFPLSVVNFVSKVLEFDNL